MYIKLSRFGRPGVEFTGQHEDEVLVRKLLFLPGQGRIVALTEDNILHLWEINGTKLEVIFISNSSPYCDAFVFTSSRVQIIR